MVITKKFYVFDKKPTRIRQFCRIRAVKLGGFTGGRRRPGTAMRRRWYPESSGSRRSFPPGRSRPPGASGGIRRRRRLSSGNSRTDRAFPWGGEENRSFFRCPAIPAGCFGICIELIKLRIHQIYNSFIFVIDINPIFSSLYNTLIYF